MSVHGKGPRKVRVGVTLDTPVVKRHSSVSLVGDSPRVERPRLSKVERTGGPSTDLRSHNTVSRILVLRQDPKKWASRVKIPQETQGTTLSPGTSLFVFDI